MELGTLLLSGLSTGSIYALVALGFNVIFKSTGAINFAQGEWVMMGGMVAATAYAAHIPLLLAVLGAVLVVVVVGLLSERIVVRQLARPTPLAITLLLIAIAICSKSAVMLVLGKNPADLPGFSGSVPVQWFGLRIHPQTFWIVGITCVVMLAIHWFFERTLLGRAMRAVAAQPEAAALCGIEPRLAMALSFGLAAGVGALAGAIITPLTLTSFDQGTVLGFKGFAAAMLGGLGSLPGALVGGVLLGCLEALSGGLISSHFKDAVAFVALLFTLFLWPAGILGKGDVERV
ncbi:MAG TPA: branched-chain amino acid ABC transporter permease [Solirubrobacteraceae bacterium]